MKQWITLTWSDSGEKVRVNLDHVEMYGKYEKGTALFMTSGHKVGVKESPSEIDRMRRGQI